MMHSQELQQLSNVCRSLGADVRYCPDDGRLTALAWESEGEQHALLIQQQIQRQTAKYPDLVCYCFDAFSTLVYTI